MRIAGAGRSGTVGKELCAHGQVVIDVGINFEENGKMGGDAGLAAAEPIVEEITPVAGGAGTVNTSVLVGNVITAARREVGL